MNKTKKVIFSVMIVLTAGFTYSGYILLGLDDDGATEIDPVLEAQQPGEEIGFKNMAHLIQSFIRSQYERRKENLDQYLRDTAEGKVTDLSKVYQDLPQTNYATRDVHRKTHGCYQADFQVRSHFIEEWNQTAATPIHDLNEVGIFKPGVTYDSIVRFSNGHPQNRDDRMADARGFAVKILPREIVNRTHSLQIQSSAKMNEATILDILSINFPTFFVGPKNTALKYYEINDSFLAGALDFTGKIKSKT
ncbi:MAG TPA: hypothetical protein VN132_14315, partial [Bdellovibrio sp.]|nr:hypothetical protein [Bdellovibrio sp.]